MTKTQAQTLIDAGLSKSFAYHVVSGARTISLQLALWLHEHDQLRVGPLEAMTPAQITAMRSVCKPKAPASIVNRRAQRA